MGAADAMTHDLPKSGYVDFPGDAAESGKLAFGTSRGVETRSTIVPQRQSTTSIAPIRYWMLLRTRPVARSIQDSNLGPH